jgi:hypothetical protein
MKITGQHIHQAYCNVNHHDVPWQMLPAFIRDEYNAMADELNRLLEETVTIVSVRCPHCSEMISAEECNNHPCFVDTEKTQPLGED